MVHGASRRRHPFTRLQVAGFVIDRISEHAFQHINALLVVGMAVRRRHVGTGRYLHFEKPQPAPLRAVHEIANFQLSDSDDLTTHDDLLGSIRIERLPRTGSSRGAASCDAQSVSVLTLMCSQPPLSRASANGSFCACNDNLVDCTNRINSVYFNPLLQ